MGFFSVTFLFLSYQLTSFFGPVGFILANCTNMFLRIVFSSRYIRAQYQSVDLKPLDGIVPNKLFAITLIVSGIVCKISEVILKNKYYFKTMVRMLFGICFKKKMYFLLQNRLFRHSILAHIAVGGICFVCTVGIWAHENRTLIKSYILKRRQSL